MSMLFRGMLKLFVFILLDYWRLKTKEKLPPSAKNPLSWICFVLTEFRLYGFAIVDSICSPSGLTSFRPSANPLYHILSDIFFLFINFVDSPFQASDLFVKSFSLSFYSLIFSINVSIFCFDV